MDGCRKPSQLKMELGRAMGGRGFQEAVVAENGAQERHAQPFAVSRLAPTGEI